MREGDVDRLGANLITRVATQRERMRARARVRVRVTL